MLESCDVYFKDNKKSNTSAIQQNDITCNTCCKNQILSSYNFCCKKIFTPNKTLLPKKSIPPKKTMNDTIFKFNKPLLNSSNYNDIYVNLFDEDFKDD